MFHENTCKKQYAIVKIVLAVVLFVSPALLFAQTDSSNYFLQKGLDEKQKGHLLESVKNFDRSTKYDEKNRSALAELATGYMDLHNYFKAKDTYKKLVDLGETSAGNYKQLFQLSFNLKQYDDAVVYANKLKQADPSEKINYYLGKINYDRDNYGDAINYLDDAIKEEPQNAEIPYMLGHIYVDMQNYKRAIPFYQKSIELDPTKYGWMYELGMIFYANNDSKNAVKYYLEAGDKGYKKDDDYLENLSMAYIEAKDFDEGIAIINDLLKKRPTDFSLLNSAAEASYDKGKYDDAINYWDKIFSTDKTNASALYMIGMCFQKKGDKSKGEQLCNRAIEMDPHLSSYRQKKEMQGF